MHLPFIYPGEPAPGLSLGMSFAHWLMIVITDTTIWTHSGFRQHYLREWWSLNTLGSSRLS
jgi:hypothetical protein